MAAELVMGTHKAGWVRKVKRPMMVSLSVLSGVRELRPALGEVCVDSGGFTKIAHHGRWDIEARPFAASMRRVHDALGTVRWLAIQDWMCEPVMLARSGLTVRGHQMRTVVSYAVLLELAPELPWLPVLQGYSLDDYLRHVEDYANAGFDLTRLAIVGLGSVCRRQSTSEIEVIVRRLAGDGLRLHGFGMKTLGLIRCADALASADSMAWSYDARRSAPLPGHPHKTCANCLAWALAWCERVEARVAEALHRPHQFPLLTA